MKLTRKQLENDLAACRKHRVEDEKTIAQLNQRVVDLQGKFSMSLDEVGEWKAVFRTIEALARR
jgi:hypothetical protein